jgi:hypothetical protein
LALMISPTTELAPSSRRLELTLGVLAVVLLGVIVWGVATGWHAGRTQKPAAVTQPSLGAPIASGPSLVPLGRYAAVGSGWRLKVVAVLRNVSQKALGLTHTPAVPGRENIVVEFTVTYAKGGRGNSRALVDRMATTIGGADPVYGAKPGCLGQDLFTVASGHAATGSACFTVAANGARRLKLAVSHGAQQASGPRTWFALR